MSQRLINNGDNLGTIRGNLNSMFAELYAPLPFSGGKVGSNVIENYQFPVASSVDLLNISPGVPGYVSSIWMTFGNLNQGKDGVISVYIDGETTPSMTTDLGTLGGHFLTSAVRLSSRHVSYEMGSQNPTYNLRWPIPFKSSIRISLLSPNTASTQGQLFSIVNYRTGVTIPWKLKSSGLTFANRMLQVSAAAQGNQSLPLLNLPSGQGNSGLLVFHSQIWANAASANYTFLENNIVAYIDGRQPGAGVYPQLNTSGSEDWWGGAYYFQNVPSAVSWGSVWQKGAVSNFGTCVAAYKDLLEYEGGIPFSDGINFTQEVGFATTPGTTTTPVDISWLVLYYVPNP